MFFFFFFITKTSHNNWCVDFLGPLYYIIFFQYINIEKNIFLVKYILISCFFFQLEEVMETETYKNAKLILERFDPDSTKKMVSCFSSVHQLCFILNQLICYLCKGT